LFHIFVCFCFCMCMHLIVNMPWFSCCHVNIFTFNSFHESLTLKNELTHFVSLWLKNELTHFVSLGTKYWWWKWHVHRQLLKKD
jgi:hypothetical protein